jgi:hypothetical protein
MPQCEHPTTRGMIRPLAELVAERRLASYGAVRPQVDACMASLVEVGVRAVTVGSYARGPSSFGDGSEVDILVLDAGELTECEVYARIVETIHPNPRRPDLRARTWREKDRQHDRDFKAASPVPPLTLLAPFTLSTQVLIAALDAALGTLERDFSHAGVPSKHVHSKAPTSSP